MASRKPEKRHRDPAVFFRIPKWLHDEAKKMAKDEHIALATWARKLVFEAYEKKESEK